MKHLKVKILIAAATAAVIGACLVGSTFATFSDKDSATNKFSVNNVTTEIVETFEETDVETSFKKEVAVKNTDVTDCLVRVRVNVTPASEENNIKVDGVTYAQWRDGHDENSTWYYNEEDGFFYYMGVLKAGDTTENLMSTVDVIDLDAMSDFKIIVYEESVQTAVYTEGTAIEYNKDNNKFETIDAIFNAYEAQSETEPTT